MKRIVIKVGGSLLFTRDNQINSEMISEFCKIIENTTNYDSITIVCGGGLIAREYIKAARKFDANEALCDLLGIYLSRINSKLIITCLKEKAFPQVPKSIEELIHASLFNKIIVMGGLQPGQSTTSVALEVTEITMADEMIILTDVDGIYDKDPNQFKDAKLMKKLNYKQLQDIILSSSSDKQAAAGEYRMFDVVSLQILKRSNLNVRAMSGKDLTEFKKLWFGEIDVISTIISN